MKTHTSVSEACQFLGFALLANSLLVAPVSVFAADWDQDGLNDAFENELINRFAPQVRLHPGDDYRPSSVPWYLARVHMNFSHDQCFDDRVVTDIWNNETLVSQVWEEHAGLFHLPPCSDNGHFQWSGYVFPGPGEVTDFFLQTHNDSNEETTRRGNLDYADCYAHVRGAPGHPGLFDVQYWFFYPYNGPIDAIWDGIVHTFAHEADWEHITVRVEPDGLTIHRIYYSAHYGEGRWYPQASASSSGFSLTEDGRPIVYSAKHTHASYPWAGSHDRNPLDIPWIGSVIVPNDDTADDPNCYWDCRGRTLNLGEAYSPMPNMEWLQYTGHWGELGAFHICDCILDITSGPHGPAFKDSWWEDLTDGDAPLDHGYVFVDGASGGPGDGTELNPFQSLSDGLTGVPTGGVIYVSTGNYQAVGIHAKPMKIEPLGGTVTLR